MNQTEYLRYVDTDVRYRVSFGSDRGQIQEFVVQLEVIVQDNWKPAIRFDTAHGFAHCDRYRPDGTIERHDHCQQQI